MNDSEKKQLYDTLIAELGKEKVITEEFRRAQYSFEVPGEMAPAGIPDVVVLPANTEECQKIVQIANRLGGVPVLPVGGITFWAGCTAMEGGIMIDTTSMSKILEIDEENMTYTVEAGITIEKLDTELRKRGYFYPVHPFNTGKSCVGSDVAKATEGAFGCGFFPPIEKHIIGMKIVLGNGDVIETGASNVIKYCPKKYTRWGLPDFTSLFHGSEGGLGVITEVTMTLVTLPVAMRGLDIRFPNTDEGLYNLSKAVHEFRRKGNLACPTIWWFDQYSMSWFYRSWEYAKKGIIRPSSPPVGWGDYPPERFGGHYLIFSVSSWVSEKECEEREKLALEICKSFGGEFVGREMAEITDSPDHFFRVYLKWELPMNVGETVIPLLGVPILKTAELYRILMDEYAKETDWNPPEMWCAYGNLTPYINLVSPLSHYDLYARGREESMEKVMEHCVRCTKLIVEKIGCIPYRMGRFWNMMFPDLLNENYKKNINRIKKALDPNNIMNPGVSVFTEGGK